MILAIGVLQSCFSDLQGEEWWKDVQVALLLWIVIVKNTNALTI